MMSRIGEFSSDQPLNPTLPSLLEAAAKAATYDSAPQLWDRVLTTLKLDLRYQVTVAEVLQKDTWRKAANPLAYIASAAVRSARRKGLPDYFEREFRRVPSDEPDNDIGTHIDSGAGFDLQEWGGGGVYERTASGAMRYVDSDDDYYYDRQIPEWLQRPDEYDAIDWETVAAYAVRKPRMASLLARVLIMRLELRIGRPEAVARGKDDDEAAAIEAAWKWTDRNIRDRIAPLFGMNEPPRPLRAEDIASFPLVAPCVTLRVDLHVQWDGSRLLLARTGLIPEGGGTFPVFFVEADSESAAWNILHLAAGTEEASEHSDIFHIWAVESRTTTIETPERLKPHSFVKPWEVLSRVSK